MTTALIGYTGFVGSNLINQFKFDDLYNSKNIGDIQGKKYDLVVCSGVPANMGFANQDPKGDLDNITQLFYHLQSANIKQLVHLSSTAVYSQNIAHPNEKNCEYETIIPYGKHRRYLEQQIINNYHNYHIIRLPALFGSNLKKNLINDILHREPSFMPASKFNNVIEQLSTDDKEILRDCYVLNVEKNIRILDKQSSCFYKLLPILTKINFTALQFTNSESVYQFYNLANLWKDINIMITHHITELNISSEPIKAKEIVKLLINEDFSNHINTIFNYDMQSIHAHLWNHNHNNYLYSSNQVKDELLTFYQQQKGKI